MAVTPKRPTWAAKVHLTKDDKPACNALGGFLNPHPERTSDAAEVTCKRCVFMIRKELRLIRGVGRPDARRA